MEATKVRRSPCRRCGAPKPAGRGRGYCDPCARDMQSGLLEREQVRRRAKCTRCGGQKTPGKGRRLCEKCKVLAVAERAVRQRERSREWYASEENRKRRAEWCRQQRALNPAFVQAVYERKVAWRKQNPEKAAAAARRDSTRRRAITREAFVEDVDPFVVFERDNGICGICCKPATRDKFDVDHVIPLARGGKHSYANVQTAHPICNRRKGVKIDGVRRT